VEYQPFAMTAGIDACAFTTAARARFDQRLALRSPDTDTGASRLAAMSVEMSEVCQF